MVMWIAGWGSSILRQRVEPNRYVYGTGGSGCPKM
jgi:hypothetical protein